MSTRPPPASVPPESSNLVVRELVEVLREGVGDADVVDQDANVLVRDGGRDLALYETRRRDSVLGLPCQGCRTRDAVVGLPC